MDRLIRILIGCILLPLPAYAHQGAGDFEPVSAVILWVTVILFFGIIGRYLALRINQPGVLGELLMGVLVGNICYFFGMPLAIILREGSAIFNIMPSLLSGVPLVDSVKEFVSNPYYADQIIHSLSNSDGAELINVAYIIDIFSRYGVIFLLFMVGLESSVDELKHTGRESIKVAVIGVAAPILLGMIAMRLVSPSASLQTSLFVAATLCATSVGITARVLKELKKLRTREARTILGAAMLDDILGLVILAIVSGIVISNAVSMFKISQIIILSTVFFTLALLAGPWILRRAVKCFHFLELWEAKLFISFVFVMALAWLASLIQLATIIGAFAAGIIIHDGYFGKEQDHKRTLSIKELVAPLEFLLAPLFFMLIGIQVKVELFFDWNVLLMALTLLIAAILGKLVSGYGGNKRDDRLLIGVGMLPRGEVGLVFASIGKSLGVISDHVFSAIILMVIITTLIAPPWLKARYAQHQVVPHDK